MLQEWGRFTALWEAARSHVAVTIPMALVWVRAAGQYAHCQICWHMELFLLNSQGLSQAIGFAGTEPE